ncbi:unnamed protein product [Macrosiphum euphorbiae]|uniref:Helitron helicase-like domain-containing protein n=1 Tax=Macrosiphum euphorbiae TaxID=13131 RepID=A0AAV0W5E6_9HEMI|nr:unnamed protein product [Macrosiphum euphorbiae]
MTERELGRLMQKKLNQNPPIADLYFSNRMKLFMKILKQKLNIVDFWFRYEYQYRGSPHVHMIIWIANAPDVRLLDSATFDQIQHYIQFYDNLVSAINPLPSQPPAEKHPSRLKRTEVTLDNPVQLAELLNRVNHHTKIQHTID